MFERPTPSDYGDYTKWASTFAEASARLDALESAISDLRHFLRDGADVPSAAVLAVLERNDV